MSARVPWFAAPWLRLWALISLALCAESVWGAVKFHGGWRFAYGGASLAGLVLAALFSRTAKTQERRRELG